MSYMGIDYIELYFTRRKGMTELEKLLLDTALFMVIALLIILVASLLFVFGM